MHFPRWQAVLQQESIPDPWRPWLANATSLTQALEKAAQAACKVNLIQETWAKPWEDEEACLSVTECWIREVVLSVRQPLVFARSVFPRALVEAFPALLGLGGQPLGRLLFANDTFQRGDIEVALIDTQHLLYQSIPLPSGDPYWARRSVFYSSMGDVLLSEVFFPNVATL